MGKKRYQIFTGNAPQHTIDAYNEDDAVDQWLNMMGYESLEHAAKEHFCHPDEIEAVIRVSGFF